MVLRSVSRLAEFEACRGMLRACTAARRTRTPVIDCMSSVTTLDLQRDRSSRELESSSRYSGLRLYMPVVRHSLFESIAVTSLAVTMMYSKLD